MGKRDEESSYERWTRMADETDAMFDELNWEKRHREEKLARQKSNPGEEGFWEKHYILKELMIPLIVIIIVIFLSVFSCNR